MTKPPRACSRNEQFITFLETVNSVPLKPPPVLRGVEQDQKIGMVGRGCAYVGGFGQSEWSLCFGESALTVCDAA